MAGRHKLPDVQLVITRRLIHADVASGDDGLSIRGAKTKTHVFTPKHDAAQTAAVIFEREIHVAGRIMFKIRNFAGHRHTHQPGIAD